MSTSNAQESSSKTIEETYIKLTPIEHVLKRPDTYVGSVEAITDKQWIYNAEEDKLEYKEITYVPAFFKIFDEILVNAADNKIRDSSMSTLKVKIDKEAGKISVYNNGKGIPIEIHKELNVYVPEMLFGQLMTSSNYNDDEKKVTGGRNGLGAKSVNIFSTQFTVETTDTTQKKRYIQLFHNNMTQTDKPKITSYSKKEEYTMISFIPDFEKFGMTGLTDEAISLLSKRVHDMAGTVKDVKVFLNDKRIHAKNFKEYVQMYLKSVNAVGASSRSSIVHEHVNDRWEISITPSIEGQFQQVSFVNSICTSKGGTHVKHVIDQIVTKLTEHIEKKNKGVKVKPFQIKNYIWIFVNCLIENPAFDSQTKENMTLKQSSFGSKCVVDDDFIKKGFFLLLIKYIFKVVRTGILEGIMNDLKSKQVQDLKKTDGVKRNMINVPKLDDAVNAGTRNAQNCILVLTEGDSAKALALAGFDVVGHNEWGVYPLRGKLLNVRDASLKQISENKEVQAIKQILGLQHNREYDSLKDLRYGSLMIMTDQDHDGSHIKGLIINFFDHFYPSLLKQPGFLREFITPIVKVKCQKDKTVLSFFTIPEYEEWKGENDNGKGWEIKYYKGLGTSTSDEAKEYFNDLDKHVKLFKPMDDEDHKLIEMAFSKKNADERKEWIKGIEDGTYIDYTQNEISIKDFINKELSLFSLSDNTRSIPSAIDGLKPGQRKVLFGCFRRNLVKGQIKVSQLSGYIAEHSAYHHGEDNLEKEMIAASARYINTRLTPFARMIFHPDDDVLLDYLNEDGQSIEPKWYVPVIPMILVNGAEGIGTGWSTNIPNYNPKDIIYNLRQMINGKELNPMHPWYRVTRVIISELPIRKWTEDYKSKVLTDLKENVDLEIELSLEQMAKAESEEGFEKFFQLTNSMATTNMMCFDPNNKLAKYDSPEDILKEFYQIRLDFYVKRRKITTKSLKKSKIIKLLESHNFDKIYSEDDLSSSSASLSPSSSEDSESENSDVEFNDDIRGYNYLMKMTCWTFNELTEISDMTATDLWIKDLDTLESAWDEFLKSGTISGDDNRPLPHHQQQPHISKAKSSSSSKSVKTPRKNKGKLKAVENTLVDDDAYLKVNNETNKLVEKNKAPIERVIRRQPKRRKVAD
ncbi:11617_t:CDS:10 [Entrophospora sp. SA101]|nr:11617_t:CDS:10 [Entrophospora sp. SA101]